MSPLMPKTFENHAFAKMTALWVAGLLLIGLFDLLGFNAVCSILKILLLLSSFVVPLESLIYVLLILSPNDSMLAMSGFISLTSAIVVVFLIRVSLHYHAEARIDRLIFLAGVLLILDALIRFSLTGENYFTGSVKIVLSFLAVAIFCNSQYDSWKADDVHHLLLAFLLGCIVLASLSFLNFYFFDLNYDRMRPVEGDPNYLSLYLCVCIALLFLWVFEGDVKGLKSIALVLLSFVFISAGLLSQSRGFIISFVPVAIYLLVQLAGRFGRKPFLVFLFILFLGIAACLLISEQSNLIDNVIARFTSKDTAGGSGRTLIWMTYFHAWFSDLGMFFFGVPQTALGNLRFEVVTGRVIAVHNLYLELLFQQGLLFTICFACIIVRFIHLMPKIIDVWHAVPVMALLFGYIFLSGALSVTLPFILLVAWVGTLSYSKAQPEDPSSASTSCACETEEVDVA